MNYPRTSMLFDQMTQSLIASLEASFSAAPYAELDQLRDWLETARGSQTIPATLIDWLETTGLSLLAAPTLSIPGRAALGQVLGLLDLDTRPGANLRPDRLPDIVWCEIPAGAFLMGSDKRRDPFAYRVEMPVKTITLDHFQIAKYPITYHQFQAFFESDDYADSAWWQGSVNPDQARQLDLQAFLYASHPRDSVTCYQAVAFCRWLTAHYRAMGIIRDHQEIRLPTEQEWEKAARGTEGNVYPYGDDFDEHQANVSDTRLKQTSAVGIFPQGASPYGVMDMSGNVYEWCLPVLPTVDSDPATRILKGGSFFLSAEWSRCAHRYERNADTRLNDVGFRVVLVNR